ncbi:MULTISPECIES: ATP-binding protein [unclassified Sphingobacterium]|uniref:DEAD/DEAH box helicase n=1 Tax=unclassified Sphingobacterium TaxID=2609468 RepID=UPI00104D31F8|nr:MULTISPECIES: DEAD/DEAH box helicase [unclassified Sphingobacterium]MCS3557259.1 energy-coupling factor transporter ATP-binding protein EcfA2 [Sphingobacterium sp. JUb21]TCQ96827.1 superfamily I DNA and/or RNA helicase [Sphingobacterium sp. JUb20]
MTYLNTLKYWRNSLADATRPAIKLKEGKVSYYFAELSDINLQLGRVDHKLAAQIISGESQRLNNLKGIKDAKDPDWIHLEQVSVLISPFLINNKFAHNKSIQDKNFMMPFLIRANLKRSGELLIPDESAPYVCRDYLEPLPPQSIDYLFANINDVDKVFSDEFLGTTWHQYYHHLARQFTSITDQAIETYVPLDYEKIERFTIIVDESIQMAADGIIKLYDHLIHLNQDHAPLLENLIQPKDREVRSLIPYRDFVKESTQHLGQMGYEYPLSITQRQSLYEINNMHQGEILAVNGPPGTGKTTLLQSIVANEVVKSAIQGEKPTLILACSTNNQAVTNIVDSFQNVKVKQGVLYERWIPAISSFALFLPSTSKVIEGDIPYLKMREGINTIIENQPFLDKARNTFLDCFQTSFPDNKKDNANTAAAFLRDELINHQRNLNLGADYWASYLSIENELGQLHYKKDIQLADRDFSSKVKDVKQHLLAFEKQKNDYFLKEPWWIKLFCFLPFIGRIREQQLRGLFREFDFDLTTINLRQIAAIDSFFESKFKLISQIEKKCIEWDNWKINNSIHANPPQTEKLYQAVGNEKVNYFFNELETNIKNDMFFLAIHYWEARWLVAMQDALIDGNHWNTTGPLALQRWTRFSMLFPCFVSTFYMAPKYFQKLKFAGKDAAGKNKWDGDPLVSAIDYLIVDESGQVTPEVGAATFSLAKKAIVVGDTLQIDPVWSVTKLVDKANYYKHDLAKIDDDYFAASDLGFLCSTGSVMKLAQKSSPHHEKKTLAKGLWLTEHRRCYNEIIDYCNVLAYKGLLLPKKGKAPKDLVLAPMSFIHHNYETDPSAVSKSNRGEAKEIATWIKQNEPRIIDYYQEQENKAATKENRQTKQLIIGDLVAIVTPFTLQKSVLKSVLQRSGVSMKNLTIGTVHALQGAERSIIIFSSVYGSNMANSSFFYDIGPNMLNVAVSRAKDSFIMFGHEGLYKNSSSMKPSNLLYNHIENN